MARQERNINLSNQDSLISLQLTQVAAHHADPGHEWELPYKWLVLALTKLHHWRINRILQTLQHFTQFYLLREWLFETLGLK